MSTKLDKTDKELRANIAARIKELREKTGLNQAEFAAEHGKDKQTQHKMENGSGATVYSISKFCKAIGITLQQFFDSPVFHE